MGQDSTRSNYRALHFVIAALFCITAGCSDDTGGSQWDLGDEDSTEQGVVWKTEDLHGPLEAPAAYVGRIGDRLYFEQNALWPVSRTNGVVMWEPGIGWKSAPDTLIEATSQDANETEHMVQAGGAFFMLNERAHLLYRSDDDGQTWQSIQGAPETGVSSRLLSDGSNLFIATADRPLWRSQDQGESWELIRNDILDGHVRVTEDFIVMVSAGGRDPNLYERSDDAGDTWQTIDSVYEIGSPWTHLGSDDWRRFDGKLLAAPDSPTDPGDGDLGVVDERGLVDYRPLEGLAEDEFLGSVVACGGRLYATVRENLADRYSSYQSLGRIVDFSRLERLTMPAGVRLTAWLAQTPVHCIGDEKLVALTDHGMWQSSDRATSWQQISSPFTTPTYVFSWDGAIYSGEPYKPVWVKPDKEQPWQLATDVDGIIPAEAEFLFEGIDDIQRHESGIYAAVSTETESAVYRLDEPGGEAQLLWSREHTEDSFHEVSLTISGDLMAIYSTSLDQLVVSTDAGRSVASVNLPEAAYPAHLEADNFRFFDDKLWVSMPDSTIWSTELDTIDWHRQTQGFPDTYKPDKLRVDDDQLFAFSSRQVYVRREGGWEAVLSNDQLEALEIDTGELGGISGPDINDMAVFGGDMVVASDARVVRFGAQGGHETIDGAEATRLFDTGSELFVALTNVGLHRLGVRQ